MRPHSEHGFSILLIPLIIALVFLVGAIVFGGWAYANMEDYKNNVAAKVATAVDAAKQQESVLKDTEAAQAAKLPYRTYTGPAAYGSVTIKYPKTWSAYVVDDTSGSPFVNGYFYPNVVPDIQGQNVAFALRVQVVQDSYSNVLNEFTGNVQQHNTTVVPYAAPNVPTIIGARISGQLQGAKNGTMVVLPLRNMTLELWTEAPQFQDDFTTILQNFTFAP